MPNLEVVAQNTRILIVGDEPDVLQATSHLLREAGYDVIQAATGEDGLRLAGETKPDLVVLDEVLPDMDGLQVCRRIKADAELAHIFVILRSATRTDPDSQAPALEVGADEYILGTISDQELLARVRAMLRIKRAEGALRESEQRYRSIVEQSLDGIRLIDEKGAIIEWNANCEEIMGLKRAEALGVPIWEVLHQLMPDDKKSPEAYERLKSGTLEFLSTGRTAWRSESLVYKIQHSDGTPRFVEERIFPITTDGVILGCGIVRDVTEQVQAREALQHSEERYAMAQQAANIGSWDWNIQTGDLHWSDQIEPMFGFGDVEFGRTYEAFLDSVHPEDRQRVVDAVNACVEKGEDYAIDHRIVWPDGTVRWVSETGGVIRNEGGEAVRMLGVVLDITDREHSVEALRESEEKFRNLAEQSPNMIFINKASKIVYANRKCEDITGYTREEFYSPGFDFLSLIAPDSLEGVKEYYDKHMRGEEVPPYEYVLVTKQGKRVDAINSPKLINYEEGTAILGVVTDITERKHAEDELRKLSRVVEQSPSIVVITDTKGYIEYVNPKFTQITGYATEEALGKNPRFLKSGEQGSEFYQDLWNTILAGQEWRGKFVNKKKNGDLYWELAIIAPIRNADGKTTRFVKLAEDITERVRAEAALRASEERYRRLLEISFDGIGIHSQGKIEFINSTGAKLLGADNLEQLIGKPIMDFVHPDYREVVRRRQMRVEETQTAPLDEEIFIRLDGSHLNVEVTAIATDYRGKPAVQVVFRDISERKRAEHALRAAKDAADAARQEEEERRQEAEQRRRIAESLADVLAALNSEQSLDDVLDLIAIQIRQLLNTEAVAIFSRNAGGEAPTIHATQGLSAYYIREAGLHLSYDALKQAMESHRPVVVSDVADIFGQGKDAERPAMPPFWAERYRAWLAVPITVRDTIYGAMLLYYAEPRPFSEDEVRLAVLLGNQVALAVENDRLRAKSEEAARAAERNRLARELHDAVTQVLFSASLIAETTPRIWERDPEKGRLGLEELRRLIQGALAEMRTLLLELRPAGLKEQRLEVLIRQLTDGLMARTRMPVAITVVSDCRLPAEVKLALYRITQEALNNVVKHAQANQAKVYLDCQPGQVLLRVSDDGRGFAPEEIDSRKLGIGIMRERAKAIGAQFTLDSQRDRGTEITVTWEDTDPD